MKYIIYILLYQNPKLFKTILLNISMPEQFQSQQPQFLLDINTRLRDLEEKQRLLKDRTLLIGQNLVESRQESFQEIQEIKKILFKLKEENMRMQELLQRIIEQLSGLARKEELVILQKQFDLFRK